MVRISYFFKKKPFQNQILFTKKGIIEKSFATPNLACTSDDNSSIITLLLKNKTKLSSLLGIN